MDEQVKRNYITPVMREQFMIQPLQICAGSPQNETERIDPDGNQMGDGDEAPSREFRWDDEDDEY